MFALRLFGGLSLESSTVAVPAGAQQRRRLTLLAMLAISDRGMSRDRIQAFLWPDSAPDRARHALDQLVYSTRRDLGSDALLANGSELRLNRNVVCADVASFDEAMAAGRWAQAADLYRGPVLDAFHLADGGDLERWLDGERMRYERAFHGALDALATAASARGDRAEVVRWRRRRAAADPVSAPAALALMHALVDVGDRAGAIHHARVYRRLVRATLDVEADPTVSAFEAEIAAAAANHPGPSPEPSARHAPEQVEGEPGDIQRGDLALAGTRPRWWVAATAAAVTIVVAVTAGPFAWRRVVALTPTADRSPAAVSLTPSAGADVLSAANRTSDGEARALYLRARTAWEKRTGEGLEEAVVLFRRASEHDPAYAAAHAGLAQSYAMLGYFGFAPADAMFPKARAAALRALELDPHTGEAYAALGQALAWQHAWEDAEDAYRRALELSPSDATTHQWYALLLAYLGRSGEAVVHTRHAASLDPLSVQINNMHGMMLYYSGDLPGALGQYARTVDAEPDSAWVRQNAWLFSNFGRVAAAAGRHREAVRLIERALRVVPRHPRPRFELAYASVAAGDTAAARAAFSHADRGHPQYAIYEALLDALVGDLDRAFAEFDRLEEWPLPALVTLNGEPRLTSFRADPRYQRIRERLGMPRTVQASAP